MAYGDRDRYGRGRGRGPPRGRGQQRSLQHEPGFQKGCHAVSEPEKTARLHLMRILCSLGNCPATNDDMPAAQVQAIETFTAQQMLEAEGVMTETLDSQPLSVVLQAFWDVLLVKGHRAPSFACLLSLVNRVNATAAEAIVEDGGRRLHDALNQRGGAEAGFGPSANHNAKVILRFYCGLAALGVVSAASTLAALRACVVAATKVASAAGSKGGDVREWLPFADFLVEASLLALPWGARALQENAAEAWAELVASVDGYLEARGETSLELALWRAQDGGDAPPNVGSAFVISTWAALKDAFGQEAPLRTIPQPQACVDNAFNMSAVFEVPAVEVPGAPPVATGDFDRRGVAVQQAYPPRGVLPLLPAHLERHPDTMTTADCLVMQEYYLHVLQAYAANGSACVEEVTTGVLAPFPAVSLLVELLISQLLLPAPPLTVFGYQSMLVRLVEHLGQPLAMAFGGCMKTLFEHAPAMDACMVHRVAELLAFFVSNNDYRWPWARWERVLQASGWDAQRRFCGAALAKLVRLCADLKFVQSKSLPQDNLDWLALIPASDHPTNPPHDPDLPQALAQPYEDMMAWLREKAPAHTVRERLRDRVVEQMGWEREAALRAFMHVLLKRGEAAPFHTNTLLTRYHALLAEPFEQAEGQDGEGVAIPAALLDTTELVWACNSQRLCLTATRLVAEELVTTGDVLSWLFSTAPGAKELRLVDRDVLRATAALELLLATFDTLASQAEATKAAVRGLKQSVPQRRAELAKAEEDMAVAQRQSQEEGTTEEEREALLTRLQALTTREAQATERLQAETQELEVGTGNLAEHRTRLHSAVRSALSHFVRAAHSLQEAAADAATAPGAGGADNGANGAAEANGADTEMVEEGAGEDEKQEAGGEAAPVAECEQKLELLLNLMAAFAARYLDAAHAPAGLLGEVLNEADAEERVRAAVQTLAAS